MGTPLTVSSSFASRAILDGLGVSYQVGKVATGEAFMTKGERADWVAKTFSPALCEMEGGAIAQVCLRNQVKFTALKSVSDRLCQVSLQKDQDFVMIVVPREEKTAVMTAINTACGLGAPAHVVVVKEGRIPYLPWWYPLLCAGLFR